MAAIEEDAALPDEARHLLLRAEGRRRADADAAALGPASARAHAAASFSGDELRLLQRWARAAFSACFRDVDDAALAEVLRRLRLRSYADGDALFLEGDAGDRFFLLLAGTVAVYSGASASAPASASGPPRVPGPVEDLAALGRRVFTYRAGESFGEAALFSADAARSASAVAAGGCEALELPRDAYLRTLARAHRPQFERSRRLHLAQRVPLFLDWPRPRVAAVADALDLRRLSFGDRLVVQGSAWPPACFLLVHGALQLSTRVRVDAGGPMGRTHGPAPHGPAPHGPASHGADAVSVALPEARAGDLVALEAVLEPGGRADYAVVAAAADVEVYALAERDARALLGGPGGPAYQQLRRMADDQQAARRRRVEAAVRALRGCRSGRADAPIGLDEGGFCAAELLGDGPAPGQDPPEDLLSLDKGTDKDKGKHKRPAAATYAPYLDADRLLAAAVGAETTAAAAVTGVRLGPGIGIGSGIGSGAAAGTGTARGDRPDVRAVAAPRMLSTCARSFVLANAEALASDYAERLALQLSRPAARGPAPDRAAPPPQRALLGHHMQRLYETKMHWDTTRKSFVLVPPAAGAGCAASGGPAAEPQLRRSPRTPRTRRLLGDRGALRRGHEPPARSSSSFVHFF